MKGLTYIWRKWIELVHDDLQQRDVLASQQRGVLSAILVSDVSVGCFVDTFLVVITSYLKESASRAVI